MIKQQNFTFATLKTKIVPPGVPPKICEERFKREIVQSGYVVKSIERQDAVLLSAICAKANVPKKDREKFQKDLDNGVYD